MSCNKYRNMQGELIEEWKDEKSRPHRVGGPSFSIYDLNDRIVLESFCLHGENHRDDGPVYAVYDTSGVVIYEEFGLNGVIFGENKAGFWSFWDCLNNKQRVNPNILKLMAKYA